jgi:hypothetical protein
MEFNNLLSDSNCNCLTNCNQDVSSFFGVKTNKNFLRDVDFTSHWEKSGGREESDCEKVCGEKGKSMSITQNDKTNSKEDVIKIFQQLFPVTPKYKPFLSIVKFKEDAGLIKVTPLKDNPFHHDFYKCDTFSLTLVELVEVIPLGENV